MLDQIEKHHIQIYQFPECDSDEDEEFKKQDAKLKVNRYSFHSFLIYSDDHLSSLLPTLQKEVL